MFSNPRKIAARTLALRRYVPTSKVNPATKPVVRLEAKTTKHAQALAAISKTKIVAKEEAGTKNHVAKTKHRAKRKHRAPQPRQLHQLLNKRLSPNSLKTFYICPLPQAEGIFFMRLLIQRVLNAKVTVNDETIGEIGHGLLVFVGIHATDNQIVIQKAVQKLAGIRLFSDEEGKMNRSVAEVGGKYLLVSQFTLYGNMQKGNRPSFTQAAPGHVAEPLFNELVSTLKRETGIEVATGRFGADMKVALCNDGPVTLWWENEGHSNPI